MAVTEPAVAEGGMRLARGAQKARGVYPVRRFKEASDSIAGRADGREEPPEFNGSGSAWLPPRGRRWGTAGIRGAGPGGTPASCKRKSPRSSIASNPLPVGSSTDEPEVADGGEEGAAAGGAGDVGRDPVGVGGGDGSEGDVG